MRTTRGLKKWYEGNMYGNQPISDPVLTSWERKYASRVLDHLGVVSGSRILDVASGTGILIQEAQLRGLESYGTDFSANAIQMAKEKHRSAVVLGDAHRLPFKDALFDFLTCLGSLEHFPDMRLALREMLRVGQDACRYCIIVPNINYPPNRLGYTITDQPLNQMHSICGWRRLFKATGFHIWKTFADNRHLLRPSVSYGWKRLVRAPLRPIAPLFPPSLSYQIGFILTKQSTFDR